MTMLQHRLGNIRHESTAFVYWWLREIRELSEALIGRIAPKLITRIVIRVNMHGEPLGVEEAPPGARACVVLPQEQVLRQELSFPASVEKDLDKVIALHLERELPVARDRVYVEHRVIARSIEDQRVTVRMYIVRRDHVEQVRARSAEWGVRLVRVAVDDAKGSVFGNFLQGGVGSSRRLFTEDDKRLSAWAMVLAVMWVAVVFGQWVYERVQVGREVARINVAASIVDGLTTKLIRQAVPAQALSDLITAPDATDVLVALTADMPRDSWAYELEVAARANQRMQIKLSGFGPAATTLVDSLERSPHFEKVHLESARSAGIGSGEDRFQLAAQWTERVRKGVRQ